MSKIDEPIYLEVYFEDEEDIEQSFLETLKTPEFKELLKIKVLERVTEAVNSKREELALFRMVYYGLDLIVEKKQFKKLLNTILTIYQQEEDYLKCVEIKNLIDKI
jgi:hypothetical protein